MFHALGKEVLQASLKDAQLGLEWKSDEWKNWDGLTNSEEFQELVKRANDKLNKVGHKGKGKGKEKSKTTSE